MKIILILLLTTITVLPQPSRAQRLWDMSRPRIEIYVAVGQDLNVAHLRQLVLQGEPLQRYAAAVLLAYHYGVSEKDFILTNLRDYAYGFPLPTFWSHFYQFQDIRGYLGDVGAIAGMDSVAQFENRDLITRVGAIERLAQIGQYNYFDALRSIYNKGGFIQGWATSTMGLYGRDSRFRDEIRTLLEAKIRSSTSPIEYGGAVDALAVFDKPYVVQLLDELFRSSSGKVRYDYFFTLEPLDPDGQPARTMWVIPLEPAENLRNDYFPGMDDIEYRRRARRYAEPFFIKYASDYAYTDTSRLVKYELLRFVYHSPVLPVLDSNNVLTQLDTLISYKHQVAGYGWLRNASFVTELDSHLTRARTLLLGGDSVNTYREIKIFQQKVDTAYQDSLSPTRGINREGWKFLHYNAQYMLARLPKPPTQFNLTINVVGSGSVAKNPNLALHDSGTTVTLTATPTNSNYRFKQWSGSVTGTTNPITVTMNGNKTVTATFVRRKNGE